MSHHQSTASEWNRTILFPILFVVAFIIRLACFTGLIGSDDLGYSFFAQLISAGSYRLDIASHFGPRLGVTVPTGIAYWLFGVSEFTTVLLPLLASSAAVILIVEIGVRLFNRRAALVAGLLLLTFPLQIRYASILVPEPIMEFWILMGVLLFLIAINRQQTWLGFLAGLSFGLAYLSKEAGLFVCVSLFIFSVTQKQWKLSISLALGLGCVGAIELLAYYFTTGDPMYRAHVIAKSQEEYLKLTGDENFSLTWRLLKEYPYQMLLPNMDFGLHSVSVLALTVFGVFSLPRRICWLLLLWAAIPFLYLNFGTVSFSKYFPSFAAPRYISQIYFPLFLIAGFVFDKWLGLGNGNRQRYVISGVLAVITVTGFSCAFVTRAQGYDSAEMASLRAIAQKQRKSPQQIALVEGEKHRKWTYAISVLSGKFYNPLDCADNCLVIRPDHLGLPHITQEALPDKRTNQESKLIYPL